MRMRVAASAAVLAVAVAACTDHPLSTSPSAVPGAASPSFSISDGAHSGGNPDFFFLPPLVRKPAKDPDFDARKFNAGLRPVVAVFPLPTAGAVGCTITAASIYGPVVAPVDMRGKQYHINWNTKASNLVPRTIYRICVFSSSGGTLLGFLDVEPIAGGMRNARTGDTYAFHDDRTLPIKFRIEYGALCANHVDRADCAEFPTVTSTGGDFTLPSGFAGVAVPPGAIAPGDIVTIVIEKQAPPFSEGTKCLPTGLVQSLGCYHFSTEPALYQFLVDVRMEACVDAQGLDLEALRLFKFNATQGLVQLPFAAPTLIDCTGFIAMADPAASPPTSFAAAALRGLGRWAGRLLAPPPLYASMRGGVPVGLGGSGGSFSDVGGAVPSSAPQAPVLLTVPASATVGQTGLSASASGGSGTGAMTFASLTAAVCTVNATSRSITLLTAGTCSLTATKAADPIYQAATSAPGSFPVSVGAAAKLAFTVQPSLTAVLTVMSPAVQVTVQDALGNTAIGFTGNVTVAITSGTGVTGAVLGGTLTEPAVNGVATFANLTIDKAGSGYALTATASGLTTAISGAFAVSCPAASDGVLCEPGWATASTFSFNANLPGGGTTPATLYVWNDATNLHLAVRLPFTGWESTLAFEFDNNNDGVASNGEDVLLLNPPNSFNDEFRTNIPPCPLVDGAPPPEASCGFLDTQDGGFNNGSGAVHSDGSFSVYEMSHLLNSGDVGHDFALAPGQNVGMFLSLRLIRAPSNYPVDFGDTDYPGFRNYLQITIK